MVTTATNHDPNTPPALRHDDENTRTGLRAACCMLLGTMLCACLGGARTTNRLTKEPATQPAAMSSTLYLAMTQARGLDADAGYHINAEGHGVNPRHGLSLTFTPQGALVENGLGELALRLVRFGRRGGAPVRQASPRIEGAWVEYARGDGLSEWFVNLPQGIEQGWTIAESPPGSGPLALELDTRRPPDRVGEGRFGWSGLVYHGLAAIDARGRRLPTRWVHDGTHLRIEVTDRAAVYPLIVDPWIQEAKLIASDGAEDDEFGFSVALSGDTALVGAPRAVVDGKIDQGAAYVFTRSGETWTEQAKLTPSDGAMSDFPFFGISVALSADTALVGAQMAEVDGTTDRGAVYVFTRSGEEWSEQAKLTASDGMAFDNFGVSLALADDTGVVGAYGADVDGNLDQGAAYVFTSNDGAWSQQAKLIASDGQAGDTFGWSVALSGDSALVGEWALDEGAAHVFIRNDGSWNEQATLTASDGESLGNCQVESTPLEDAIVEITGAQSTYTLETRYDGFFRTFLPDVESPLDITVTAPGHLPATREGITFDGGDIVVQDFDLVVDAPCASVEPASLSVELEPNQSTTEILTLGNVAGATELSWTVSTAAPPALDRAPLRRRGSIGSHPDDNEPGDPLRRNGSSQGHGAVETVSSLGAFLPGVRPLHPATGVVNCDDEPGLILHDDGTIENAYSGDPDSVTSMVWADRFTPSAYPATFDAVCVAFATGGPTSLQFEVVVFDDDGPDGAPGTELGALSVSAEGIPGDVDEPVWLSYDISSLGIVIDSGSVYIGPRWAPSDPNVFIAADESTGNPAGFGGGYWWNDDDAVWAPIESVVPEYRSLFVRAVENPGGCLDPTTISWLSLEPISGTTPAGGTSDVEVAIDSTGLTPGVFEASLCIESNDPIRPLLVVPLALTVTEEGAPELAFDPSSLDFGDVEIGTTSAPQTATLQNTGDVDATGITFTLPGSGFEVDTSACDDTLPAGEGCPVSITFTPAGPGPAEASLEASSAEGASAALSLTGNGIGEGFTPMALEVDPEPFLADGNGVFEPGETVEVAPAWRNDGPDMEPLTGTVSDFNGPDGAIYVLFLDDADYASVEPGATASCRDTGVCYFLAANDPAVRPATHWKATFEETLSDSEETPKTWTLHIGDSFADVPRENPFYGSIEALLHHGVTEGCTATEYCPAGANSRSQMAAFLLRAAEGGDYTPPACEAGDETFDDVPASSTFCPWIEELAARSVTSGCSGNNYCPATSVTRAQMAVFLLKAAEGEGYTPPPCLGTFTDVPCPSTFAAWIEDLANRGVTSGCSATTYCPGDTVTRQQMAVFLGKAFGLVLYGP